MPEPTTILLVLSGLAYVVSLDYESIAVLVEGRYAVNRNGFELL
jgi:hypothetical protein